MNEYLAGQPVTKPSSGEIKDVILRQAEMMLEYKGEYIGIREMRKHLTWYLKGFEGAAGLRRRINETETFEELKDFIKALDF